MLNIKKKILVSILAIVIIFNLVLTTVIYAVLPDFAIVESNTDNVQVNRETETYKTAESSVQTASIPTFTFQSESQILMEATTGEVIYANNENARLLPASVTKIMTLLLVMEQIDGGNLRYTDNVTCSMTASQMGGSQIWFKEGETLTVDEALKCICVVSANDVSYAMAELVGGSHENFVQMMNDKAKALGMENTHFMNAHGIDEEGHYTTAKDIALMSKELITKHPDIYKYTTIWMDTIRNGEFGLSNTNKLLKTYDGITGLKTGSTSQAGFNLSATATRNGLSLITVVLKAPTSAIRNEEVTTLLNYGFSAYSSKQISQKGEMVDEINISKNVGNKVKVVYKNDEYLVSKKGENTEYTTKIEYSKELKAPLIKDEVIGKVQFLNSEGQVIHEAEIALESDVKKSNLWDYMTYIFRIYSIEALKI